MVQRSIENKKSKSSQVLRKKVLLAFPMHKNGEIMQLKQECLTLSLFLMINVSGTAIRMRSQATTH